LGREFVELETMRSYELVLVLKPSLKEDERKKLLSTVLGYFGESNVVKQDDWGQRTLSYAVKRETSAYYVRLLMEIEGEIPPDFEKRLLSNDNVLRHLFLRGKDSPKKKEKAEKKPEEKKPAEKKTTPKATPSRKSSAKAKKK
jgi:small subunit ribosomal protein S6